MLGYPVVEDATPKGEGDLMRANKVFARLSRWRVGARHAFLLLFLLMGHKSSIQAASYKIYTPQGSASPPSYMTHLHRTYPGCGGEGCPPTIDQDIPRGFYTPQGFLDSLCQLDGLCPGGNAFKIYNQSGQIAAPSMTVSWNHSGAIGVSLFDSFETAWYAERVSPASGGSRIEQVSYNLLTGETVQSFHNADDTGAGGSFTTVNGQGSGVFSFTVTNGADTVTAVTVRSQNPDRAVPIAITPADSRGVSNSPTPFALVYNDPVTFTLTAPDSFQGRPFQTWQKNGSDFSSSSAITLPATQADVLTAVYCPLTSQIVLHIDRGATLGQALLAWSGSLPDYTVFRSLDPSTVTNAENRLLVTPDSQIADDPVPPLGSCYFYVVTSVQQCS